MRDYFELLASILQYCNIASLKGSKVQVAGWAVYVTVLWLIKSSMCAFYSRLTNGLPEYRRRIRWGFILIAVTYLVVLGVILLGCQPLHRLWQIYPDPGNFCQPAISKLLVFLVLTLNVITDAYLLILPIPALRKAQVTRIKRVMLMLLFSGGVFVMAAGILRCVLIIKNPTKGPQQAASWAVRESFVAVVTSSTPVIWGWMKQRLKPLFSSVAILTDPQDSKDAGGMTTLTPTGIQGKRKRKTDNAI
ncbi:hypothetical protein BHE90_009557 [Fusarium euwallaceae]|uniref:Rhodopsin domain-containing protein n=2 Tax=Fusarium solani species complex TaxID=232080 RepID=A0A430LJX3_9HYPO|nr:hypothetical protein CDV31_013707 [Fusarium ambrosium]RTE75970.1 hypothetical protein BHE90_009557 [Fusarium euwallaceae]